MVTRFIPTLVGNTRNGYHDYCRVTVHPHARGEHVLHRLISHGVAGSSPRSWGTPSFTVDAEDVRRFIPTLVGNTLPGAGRCRGRTVHPHARGEHPAFSFHLRSHVRFIPTLVGNTPITALSSPNQYGSSPRSWGTLRGRLPSRCCRPVHPHARGEHIPGRPNTARQKHG